MKINDIENVFLSEPDELEVFEQTPEERTRATALENYLDGKSRKPLQVIDPYEHDLNEKDYLGQF